MDRSCKKNARTKREQTRKKFIGTEDLWQAYFMTFDMDMLGQFSHDYGLTT